MKYTRLNFQKIKVLIYSIFYGLKINIIGSLPSGEILVLLDSLSIRKWKRAFKAVPDLKKINIAFLVLLISQIISDLVNDSTLDDSLRGCANIIMGSLVITFLSRYIWNSTSILITFLIGQILCLYFFQPNVDERAAEDMAFFKFVIAPILNNVVLLITFYLIKSKRFSKLSVGIFVLSYGLFCIVLDYRSNGMTVILTAIVYLNVNLLKRITIKKLAVYTVFFILLFQILYSFYVYEVLSNNIGNEHTRDQLVRTKNPYNMINLLISGRPETFVAIEAIADKPIFGHGSWAPDPTGKYNLMLYKLIDAEDKYIGYWEYSDHSIIPSHSVIFGTYLTAGIMGGAAMIYIMFLFIRRGLWLVTSSSNFMNSFLVIIIFFLFNGAWIFLFSPLPHIRQTLPIMIAFIITMYRKECILKENARRNLRKSYLFKKSQEIVIQSKNNSIL